jgi:ankyrin repeat protein
MVSADDSTTNVWIASSDGDIDAVRNYLQHMSPDSKDENGYSILSAAASYGHKELVRILIEEFKANPNIQDEEGDAPLHICQDIDTIKLLVQLGADPTLRNHENKLPIEVAFIECASDVVEFLKEFTPDYIEYEQDVEEHHNLEYLLNELQQEHVDITTEYDPEKYHDEAESSQNRDEEYDFDR